MEAEPDAQIRYIKSEGPSPERNDNIPILNAKQRICGSDHWLVQDGWKQLNVLGRSERHAHFSAREKSLKSDKDIVDYNHRDKLLSLEFFH